MQISIINKSELENEFTIGAEYYHPDFVSINKLLSMKKNATLHELCSKITDGDHSTTHYTESGVLYLLSEAINEGYIDLSLKRFISRKRHDSLKRSKLKAGDILVTKTGAYFGKSAVVPKGFPEANTSAHVGILRLKNRDLNPYYLSTFLNTKFGYAQLRRRGMKVSRPEIKLIEFKDIKVFIPSNDSLQQLIQKLIIIANEKLEDSNEMFLANQFLLLNELGFSNWEPKHKLSFIKYFSDTQKSQRLDAEYFQPKYDEIVEVIKNYKGGWDKLSKLVVLSDEYFSPQKNQSYKYIELSDIGFSGEIIRCTVKGGKDLPLRARRIVQEGDLIVSSIEGSLDKIALIPKEYHKSLCSTGFYILKPKHINPHINPETLLVFLKSIVGQSLLKKGCNDTILTAISKNEFESIAVPKFEANIQEQIREKIIEASSLRQLSKKLLKISIMSVEMAIEKNEEIAVTWMKNECKKLGVEI